MKNIQRILLTSTLLLSLLFASPSAGFAEQSAKESAKSYWTLDKIKNAKTYEMQFDTKSKTGKRTIVRDQQPRSPFMPGVVTGLPWTQGGIPETSTGKVFFSIGLSDYTCSGSLVAETSTSRAIILTAGHCAYEQVGIDKRYVQNWIFIPRFQNFDYAGNQCQEIYGCWSADTLTVDSVFSNETNFTETATAHDWAFATIMRVPGGALPDDQISGLYPLRVGINGFVLPDWKVSYSFGYPAAGKFKGRDLYYCKGDIAEDLRNQSQTWAMRCDMTGGSSGGPWVSRYNTADQQGLSSVNSYKYINDRKRMYGPKFTTGTQETMNEALTK